MLDPVAADVLAAFEAAQRAGLPLHACYKAGVSAWRQAHPDQRHPYASQQAITVILSAKVSLRVPD